jgi:7-carboxy-7-deazaguanine synthase
MKTPSSQGSPTDLPRHTDGAGASTHIDGGAGLQINEIFFSIQGESTHAGRPCVFVRLTGCNLRCKWCDTAYAFYEGRRMPVAEIVAQVISFGCDLVEITGGEPLLQEGVHDLMGALLDVGREVMLETSGASDISRVDPRVIKIVDIKCPASGESIRNLWSNLEILGPRDELKFVIADRADYEWVCATIVERELSMRANAILMSPVHGSLDSKMLAEWMLEDRIAARLQLQIHKIVWGADRRGV